MKITMLFDEAGESFQDVERALDVWAQEQGHTLEVLKVAAMDIKPCLGCFACWVRTPGTCVLGKDDGPRILQSFVHADLVIAWGPTPWGSFSPAIKAAFDRMLPSLLPYFKVYRGEMHHLKRYPGKTRLLHAASGPANPAEESTFRELCMAHCDNVGSPHAGSQYRHRGSAAEFVEWIAREVAS